MEELLYGKNYFNSASQKGRSTFKKYKRLLEKEIALKNSSLLQAIEVLDLFEDKLTLRFYFSSKERNITEADAKNEFGLIQEAISK